MSLREDMLAYRKRNTSKHSPAYLMYTNEVMNAIIKDMPSSVENLYMIKGVRKDFVSKHGASVLRIIASHRRAADAASKGE